jgi:BlaR1 peptidase M56
MNVPLWSSNLLFWSTQVALLAMAAAILIRLLRIRHPRVLLVQWRALLVVSLLPPVLQPWHRATIPAGVPTAPNPSLFRVAPVPSLPAPHWQLPSWSVTAETIGAILLFGIALRFALFAVGIWKLGRLRRASSVIPAGTACAGTLEHACAIVWARAEFRISARVDSPVTFGFRTPVILLPDPFLHLEVGSQTTVVCHELLHARRRDWLHHLAEEFLRIGFWFHPAILWLVARIRLAREQVVDLEVLRLTQARKAYLSKPCLNSLPAACELPRFRRRLFSPSVSSPNAFRSCLRRLVCPALD